MPTIKLNTGGSVILKGGKPSCTCCCPCSPDVTTLYVEYTLDPLGTPSVSYFEMTGSLCTGNFAGTSPYGDAYIEWTGSQWIYTDPLGGAGPGNGRCDPQGTYLDADFPDNEFSATISFTPLP